MKNDTRQDVTPGQPVLVHTDAPRLAPATVVRVAGRFVVVQYADGTQEAVSRASVVAR